MGKAKAVKPVPAEMIPVESSNIKEIGWNESTEVMFVRFNNDSIYSYYPVSKIIWKHLNEAKSKGAYFHNNIKFSKEIKYRPRPDLY